MVTWHCTTCCRDLLLRTFVGALRLAISMVERNLDGKVEPVVLDAGEGVGYRWDQGRRFQACWGPAPYVIHPIDPTCNVARVSAGWVPRALLLSVLAALLVLRTNFEVPVA